MSGASPKNGTKRKALQDGSPGPSLQNCLLEAFSKLLGSPNRTSWCYSNTQATPLSCVEHWFRWVSNQLGHYPHEPHPNIDAFLSALMCLISPVCHTKVASKRSRLDLLVASSYSLLTMASKPLAMASTLAAMASNLRAMASNLLAMASTEHSVRTLLSWKKSR